MPTLLETQVQSVLNDGRSSAHNMLRSDRTFAEILRDPKTGDENKRDVVDAFVRTFKGDLALIRKDRSLKERVMHNPLVEPLRKLLL